MVLLVDAGGLYAQADRADSRHQAVVELLRAERGPLVTSQIAVAEADYLILTPLASTSNSHAFRIWQSVPSSPSV